MAKYDETLSEPKVKLTKYKFGSSGDQLKIGLGNSIKAFPAIGISPSIFFPVLSAIIYFIFSSDILLILLLLLLLLIIHSG